MSSFLQNIQFTEVICQERDAVTKSQNVTNDWWLSQPIIFTIAMDSKFKAWCEKYPMYGETIQNYTFIIWFDLSNSHNLEILEDEKWNRYLLKAERKNTGKISLILPYSTSESLSMKKIS